MKQLAAIAGTVLIALAHRASAQMLAGGWLLPASTVSVQASMPVPDRYRPGQALVLRFGPAFGARVQGTLAPAISDAQSRAFAAPQQLRVQSAGAMFDLFPFRSGFRISGGARVNGNDARSSSLGSPVPVGAEFTPAQAGAIHVASIADDFAPVLTVGYAGSIRERLTIGIEAGALFQGHARAAAYNPNSGANPEGDFLTLLERDRLNQADSFSNYAPSPMAQFTATLRF